MYKATPCGEKKTYCLVYLDTLPKKHINATLLHTTTERGKFLSSCDHTKRTCVPLALVKLKSA